MQNICKLHNIEQTQVLQEEKVVIYCSECAKLNILSIIQLEDQIDSQKQQLDLAAINKKRWNLIKQVILGLLVAIYIQILPWFFAPIILKFDMSQSYFVVVAEAYKWIWTRGWMIMLSITLFIWGLYNVKDAILKIQKLPSLKLNSTKSKKDILLAVKRFQASNRLAIAQEYIKKIHKKYIEEKTTVTPINVMTEYELALYYAKLIKHLDYENVRLTVPVENYGISMIATKKGVKTAMMVVKDTARLKPEVMSRLGIGRAYFDCDEAIILVRKELPSEIQKMADEFVLDVWNMKEIEEKITSSNVDDWSAFLDDFLIKSDTDLEKYAIYEKQRLIHFEK